MIQNESKLIKSLSKGNLIAFNTFFKEYSPRLYRFAFRYFKSDVEAEEIVQEVFLKIWEKRSDLKEELSFQSYLFTISFNMIKKHFRSRVHLIKYIESETNNKIDLQTIQRINYNSLYQHITKLTEQLPERRRTIFIKSRFEGQSVKEIAKELKISHKTVENQLTDALKFIRTRLKSESVPALLFLTLFLL